MIAAMSGPAKTAAATPGGPLPPPSPPSASRRLVGQVLDEERDNG
jgi:hypothetical protein